MKTKATALQSIQPMTSLSTWLLMASQVYVPQEVMLVGAGNGTGPLVQGLLSMHGMPQHAGMKAHLLEAHAPTLAQLAKRLGPDSTWQLSADVVLSAHCEDKPTYHHYSLGTESSLLPPSQLQTLWPSLQLMSEQPVSSGVPINNLLNSLLSSSWLLLDCLPAAYLLQGSNLSHTHVLLARVVLGEPDTSPSGSTLVELQAQLGQQGYLLAACFAERNTQLAKTLWLRDPSWLQHHAKAQATKMLSEQSKVQEAQAKISAQELQSLQNKLEAEAQAKQDLQAKLLLLRRETVQLKSEFKNQQNICECTVQIGADQKRLITFNSKSDTFFTNKIGQVKFDLPSNTPAYLVSSEAGDFERAPQFNQINLEPNKVYELSASVKYEGATAPIVWFFEYDEKHQRIKSHSCTLLNGVCRLLFKTQPNAVVFALGIRLGGEGAIDPRQTHFQFENTFAIEVAEALQQGSGSLEKKLVEVQSSLQKQQETNTKNSLRQIESFLRLQNYCGNRLVLPDMHGWPVSPDLGVYLIRLIETGQYDAVVEFGSGVSTMLIALAIQKSSSAGAKPTTACLSFEHLDVYLAATAQQLRQSNLQNWVQLVHAPLVETLGAFAKPTQFYNCDLSLRQLRQKLNKTSPKLLVFVDGPPASTGPYARYPALDVVDTVFEGTAQVHYLLDDYIRQDEREIVALWETHLRQQNRQIEKQVFSQFEKQACLLSVAPTNATQKPYS